MACFFRCVTGIDASKKRVDACINNADRMGIKNTSFLHYDPCEDLPFEDGSFDGITAASSVEQSLNPKKTVNELYRVLRKGCALRINYEALSAYRENPDEIFIMDMSEASKIVLYRRNIKKEYAEHYGITVNLPKKRLGSLTWATFGISELDLLKNHIIKVQKLRTIHPSGRTFMKWMREAGFSKVRMTHTGQEAALKLFKMLKKRPVTMNEIDRLLMPVVAVTVSLDAPIERDLMITAVK